MSTDTNTGKSDKEKTVKKRAARSIVAPRLEEEVNSHTSNKKEVTYIPGAHKPKSPEPAKTLASPVRINTEPGKKRPAKELKAPTGLWNEDKAEPVKKAEAKKAVTATGWPDRPPKPRVPQRSMSPSVGSIDIHANPARQSSLPGIGQAQGRQTPGMQRQLQGQQVAVNPQTPGMQTRPGASVQTQPAVQTQTQTQIETGPLPGTRYVKKVVTTTTTTYEPVTEEMLKQLGAQAAPLQPAPTTQTVITTEQVNAAPNVAQTSGPAVQRPVTTAQPAAGRPAGTQPVQHVIQRAEAASRQPGTGQPVIQQSQVMQPAGQPRQPVQPSGQPVRQTGQPVQQVRQPVQPGQPVGQPGSRPVQPAGTQPGQPAQSIIGTMEARGSANPANPMEKKFAEIEKALGLTGEEVKNQAAMNTLFGPLPQNPPAQTPPPVNCPVIGDKPIPVGTPVPAMDRQTKKTMEYMMLGLEGLIFLIVLCVCISIYQKIKKGGFSSDDNNTEITQEASYTQEEPADMSDYSDQGTESFDVEQAGAEDMIEPDPYGADMDGGGSGQSGSVDVDNDDFTLKCTNVTVKLDTEGNPAALIYFSFTNKTSDQLALSDVFPISVTQNGEACETSVSLDEYPEEFYNKDMQISDGSTLDCAYTVSLKDAVSPLTLTVHDNYQSFSDVGTTEIAIQ